MIKLLLINLAFLFTFFTIVSAHSYDSDQISPRKERKILARENIRQLKEGALLVRLFTKQNTIQALRDIGRNDRADAVEQKQTIENEKIIKAFTEEFSFCPVYFFYSDYTPQIKEKKMDQVVFVNKNLEEDSSIQLNFDFFLIAEFGRLQQDTIRRFDSYYYDKEKGKGIIQTEQYYGGPLQGFGALVIKNDQFYQLTNPFPYYIKTFSNMRKPARFVRNLDEKMHFFYRQNYRN